MGALPAEAGPEDIQNEVYAVGKAHGFDPLHWAGFVVYGVLKAVTGLRLSAEEEYEGADLSIHKIGATPDREVSW